MHPFFSGRNVVAISHSGLRVTLRLSLHTPNLSKAQCKSAQAAHQTQPTYADQTDRKRDECLSILPPRQQLDPSTKSAFSCSAADRRSTQLNTRLTSIESSKPVRLIQDMAAELAKVVEFQAQVDTHARILPELTVEDADRLVEEE
ncbi:hypothetical protein C0993_004661 [Termitomyces sp. T159_Od127]|nr:hypothetical protein C0993_004661 [Termitomyces sp. T159_Od127]